MNLTGDDFFANAAFTLNKNNDIGVGDLNNEFLNAQHF